MVAWLFSRLLFAFFIQTRHSLDFVAVELLEYIKIKYLSDIMSTDLKGPDIEDFCVLKPISRGAFG